MEKTKLCDDKLWWRAVSREFNFPFPVSRFLARRAEKKKKKKGEARKIKFIGDVGRAASVAGEKRAEVPLCAEFARRENMIFARPTVRNVRPNNANSRIHDEDSSLDARFSSKVFPRIRLLTAVKL